MNEIDKTNLSEQTKYRLSEIIVTENYFHQEISQRKLCINKLSKYVSLWLFYIHKTRLIVLSTITGGVSTVSFTNSKNSKSKFYFSFFSNNKNNKKITKHNKKQKEKAW